jgi:hypothetical protein
MVFVFCPCRTSPQAERSSQPITRWHHMIGCTRPIAHFRLDSEYHLYTILGVGLSFPSGFNFIDCCTEQSGPRETYYTYIAPILNTRQFLGSFLKIVDNDN